MCRSIKTLRPPVMSEVTDEDIHAAAVQYVRKVSGFRAPAAHNRLVFDRAVLAVAEATRDLLADLEVSDPAVLRSAPGGGKMWACSDCSWCWPCGVPDDGGVRSG